MLIRNFVVSSLIAVLFTIAPSTLLAHHMAPEEISDFITEQLIEVDSPHLLSSDDDPSLLNQMVEGIDDLDYVVVIDNLSANEVTAVLEDILEQLARENEICDVKYVIEYDDVTQTFSLTIYVDYCNQ